MDQEEDEAYDQPDYWKGVEDALDEGFRHEVSGQWAEAGGQWKKTGAILETPLQADGGARE
jgi:hypothetical protein